MVFTTLCYVSLLFSITVSSTHQTNLYPNYQEAAILANRPEVASRIYGSKLVVAVEQLMLCTIWGTKLSVGLFIRRMVIGHTRYQRAVYATMTYIGVSFVALEAVYFSLCRPFSGYWMLPVPDEQCATLTKYTILQACLNITSDLALLVIPVHVIWRQQYFRNGPLQRKLVRVALFGSVGFTIVAAVLGKIFNWTNLYTTTYLVWYIIEASVATMVGNLISVWKLVKKILETTAYERRVTWEKTKNLARNLRYSCSYALSKIKMPKMSRQSRHSGTNFNGPSPFSAQRASNTRASTLHPRTERVYLPPRKVGLPFGQSSEYLFSHTSHSPGGRSQYSVGGLSLEERYELHMF
ncbi:hypothetical protein B0O99DRAFT_632355 [Bisporella sp. PMI_857]|nr:hypothetical protein B0O99DRAFT_632355 [Bisporella sp. PMI_857]